MNPDSKYAMLSKTSLQDVLLRRLAELNDARKNLRRFKDQVSEIKAELVEIKSLLLASEVIPFKRDVDMLRELPEVSRRSTIPGEKVS